MSIDVNHHKSWYDHSPLHMKLNNKHFMLYNDIFKRAWQTLKTQSCPSQPTSKRKDIRAVKWGTKHLCISRSFKLECRQNWKFVKTLCLYRKLKCSIFGGLQLYSSLRYRNGWYLNPKLCLEKIGQGHGSTFKVCHALLKSAILLHTEAVFRFFLQYIY